MVSIVGLVDHVASVLGWRSVLSTVGRVCVAWLTAATTILRHYSVSSTGVGLGMVLAMTRVHHAVVRVSHHHVPRLHVATGTVHWLTVLKAGSCLDMIVVRCRGHLAMVVRWLMVVVTSVTT